MVEDGRAVGVADVTSTPETAAVVDAIEAAGADPRVDAPSALAAGDLAAIVAPGTDALRAVASEAADADVERSGERPPASLPSPILPVDCGPGFRSVAVDRLTSAVESVLRAVGDGDELPTDRHPILAVSVDGERVGTSIGDATLVTAAPARISEFAVDSDALGRIDEVRADGVVVATPAGSRGYAAAGDGPLLAPDTGLAVVPVAPFRTQRATWVLPEAPVSVRIRRDEAAVAVEIDGEVERTVGQDATVRFEPDGAFDLLTLEQSGPAFP